MTAQLETDPLLGQVLQGRFELLSRIGEGGTGVVYKAKQLAVDRVVAIKVLGAHVSSDPMWVKRFHTEARAAAKLDHPNTVRIIDFGQTVEGLLFLAMEFLQGRPLADELSRLGKLPPERMLRILVQICLSLHEAHSQGIIHRDIKPDNVFLLETKGGRDFVKVLDFSIAKLNSPDAQQTRAGTVFGTPAYMSPEQARGVKLTPQSDVYACGILAYEMLTGKPPFEAPLPMEVVMMHLRQKPAPLSGFPEPVIRLVMKAIEKTVDRRHKSAEELARECEECLEPKSEKASSDVKLAMRMEPPPAPPRPEASALRTLVASEVPPDLSRFAGRNAPAPAAPVAASPAQLPEPSKGLFPRVSSPNPTPPATLQPKPTPTPQPLPLGISQLHELPCRGYVHAWSLDGKLLAVGCSDKTVRIWDAGTGQIRQTLRGHLSGVIGVSWFNNSSGFCSAAGDQTLHIWNLSQGTEQRRIRQPTPILSVTGSPTSMKVVTGSLDGAICVWEIDSGDAPRLLKHHRGGVSALAFSPDGRSFASASFDGTLALWDAESGQLRAPMRGHDGEVLGLAWSADGQVLASVSKDRTVRIWDPLAARTISVIEGHTATVNSVSFSHDGALLATQSRDDTLRLWNRKSLQQLCVIRQPRAFFDGTLCFHPRTSVLATISENRGSIRIWELEPGAFLGKEERTDSVYYTNAKIVLIGETGVGKSALGMVLAGEKYEKTDSTHARKIWVMERPTEVNTHGKERRIQEILLWDLAGQPGYRPIHQLSLKEVTVALVVIDARSEIDPFAGVQYWVRALRQAQRNVKDGQHRMKKILVAARVDRGALAADQNRIQEILREYGFIGYIKTSAREGTGIAELKRAIHEAIDWEALLVRSSNELFHRIKHFLEAERDSGQILAKEDQMYQAFLRSEQAPAQSDELRAQFRTCVNLVERRGLIRLLGFGELVLLRPELLDSYAWALLNAAKDEPDGLGYISEKKALAGTFPLSASERVPDRHQEEILLIAVIRDLLSHEIALREETGADCQLVFPSQLTRHRDDLPDPPGKLLSFSFEGALATIYATLAVRLSRSESFRRKDMWHNAVTYRSELGGVCGMFLQDNGEGQGRLTLFSEDATQETINTFEAFIYNHLRRHVEEERIQRHRTLRCAGCGELISEGTLARLKANSKVSYRCPICGTETPVGEHTPTRIVDVRLMNQHADHRRDKAAAELDVLGKLESGVFDIWFQYEAAFEPNVRNLSRRLRERGILAWCERGKRPGAEKGQCPQIKSVIVCVGQDGRPVWGDAWDRGALEILARRNLQVGLLLLPGCSEPTEVPPQLRTYLVDLRTDGDGAINQLVEALRDLRPQGYYPTPRSLRELLREVLRTEAEFSAFCLDFFRGSYRAFATSMDRTVKENALLEREDPVEILTALRHSNKDAYTRYESVLRFEHGPAGGI